MKQVKIAILGMGTVGTGVYKVIENEGAYIAHKNDIDLSVKKVFSRSYHADIPMEKRAKDLDEIVNDSEISIVVEVMGGIEPAFSFIKKALEAGKTVVSANKQLIASHWAEVEQTAKKTGAGFYFEASVGGGIPILRTVNESLQANTITSLSMIINGTTNYILSKMTDEGASYEDVLAEAQRLGYAEANPSADVDGFDSMYKLSILASMAFHVRLPIDYIYREGITKITAEDIAIAKELGMTIKLLAIAKRQGELVENRVHPTMIPADSPLANVKDSFNAIMLQGSAVGDLMLYGRGAGELPTASAVVSDVIYAAKETSHRYMTFMNEKARISPTLVINHNWETRYYLRLKLEDQCGILAMVCTVFGDNNVSIDSVIQKGVDTDGGVTVVFVTHKCHEQDMQNAVKQLKDKGCVLEIKSLIRVED